MSAALVPVENMAAIEALAPDARAIAVTTMLTEARSWLAHAVEASEPTTIANFKAQMATVSEATKQLGLSKEIQLDAQEMVRLAERGLGVAIRKGQASGTVETPEEARRRATAIREVNQGRADQTVVNGLIKPKPTDFASDDELRSNGAGIYHLTDGVSDEEFEAGLTAAKAEGNLSRANVVRKVRSQNEVTKLSRKQRADTIADLAAQGYSSRQMPSRVGVTEETIREIAREFGIAIPADKIIGRTRRIDHTHMVTATVDALDNLVAAIPLIDFAEVDYSEADEWVTSVTASIAALQRFLKQIRKVTHV